jgi:pyrroloquinoline quinone biosynthesis protein E
MKAPSPPIGLLAELTHRCPLQCPYCSNPLHLDRRSAELDTATWKRVFSEADALGVLQLHLSGGEPTARADLLELVSHCAGLGLYTNLITSGVLLDQDKVAALADAGLDHVQLSLQDIDPVNADQVAGFRGGHARKLKVGEAVVAAGLPLTVNAVIHRRNIGSIEAMVELALGMGARRIEIAHAQ